MTRCTSTSRVYVHQEVRQVPNQPKTPHRQVRVEESLWRAAMDKARAEGRTISDVVRKALEAYVGRAKEEQR